MKKFAKELWGFMRSHKKVWLPLLALMVIFALLAILLGGSGAAPFIYTLF